MVAHSLLYSYVRGRSGSGDAAFVHFPFSLLLPGSRGVIAIIVVVDYWWSFGLGWSESPLNIGGFCLWTLDRAT